MRNGKINKNKVAIDLIPFSILFYFTNKYLQAVCASTKTDAFDKCIEAFSLIFQVPPVAIPCFKALPLIGGIAAGVIFKLYLNSRKKNAKQFRKGEEYGSAKWGTEKDFDPYMDSNKWNNIPLTATEWLRMTRPLFPKYDRNKNILIVGGSGAGKTRGFVKPNLMQMHSSFCVTDPKGTVLVETGKMLQRGYYLFYKDLTKAQKKQYKSYPRDKSGRVLSRKTGKPIRIPYKIKVFNTINFKKSLHYNPFAYIKTEQDILKFVNTLIANTKGEGAQSGEDFWVKAERLLFTALVAYIVTYCKPSEKNFVSLLAMIDASETREDDEIFENAIDLMFKDIENGNEEEGIKADPDSFAVRQYKKYKLAAGKTAKSILISCGAGLAPFDIQEIREITAELVNGKAPDWGEGWADVQKAIRRYGWCREKEALDSLSPASRQAAERIGWRDICNSENPETLRAQFRQIYQAETQRQHKDACLPESVKKLIAGIGNSTTAALPVRGNDKWK